VIQKLIARVKKAAKAAKTEAIRSNCLWIKISLIVTLREKRSLQLSFPLIRTAD
jgi:hypothetical protein|tara:strand:+ start:103 stop:264 length:162 start_codon:yes stop_codon:yes gene_type:complete